MKNECSIIKDLLPLYAEHMVSPDTEEFVEEHLKTCEACRKEYESLREPRPAVREREAAPLQMLSRKLKHKKLLTIALTAVLLLSLFAAAFAVLDAPVYLPWSEDLLTVTADGGSGIHVTFREDVTDFRWQMQTDPEGASCDIEAWTSLWDQWFSKGKGKLTAEIPAEEPVFAVYLPNDGTEDVCLGRYDPDAGSWSDENLSFGHRITMPRLALNFYAFLAGAALIVLGILWIFVRKKAEVRLWVERIGLLPVAWLISHLIVSGFGGATYSMSRDFAMIVFLSILLWSGLLLAHHVIRLKREIRKINPPSEKGKKK